MPTTIDFSTFFYNAGTATFTNGSDIVNGSLTAWDTAVLPLDIIHLRNGGAGISMVKEVISPTQLKLAAPWAASTVVGGTYQTMRWTTHTDPRNYGPELADALTKLRGIPADTTAYVAELTGLLSQMLIIQSSTIANSSVATAAAAAALASKNSTDTASAAAVAAQTTATGQATAAAGSASSAGTAATNTIAAVATINAGPVATVNGKGGIAFIDLVDILSMQPSLDLGLTTPDAIPGSWFTRITTGYRKKPDALMESVAFNALRIEHDDVGLPRGALVEALATNLCLYSQDPQVGGWALGSNASWQGLTTAPDGTNTARIFRMASTGFAYFLQTFSQLAATTYTASFWAKVVAGTPTTSGAVGLFDYHNGATVVRATMGNPITSGLSSVWKRFSVTFTNVTAGSGRGFYPLSDFGNIDVAIWGLQVEVGSVPTSLIPTVNNPATRAADNLVIPTAGWLNTTEFSGMVEFWHVTGQIPNFYPRVLTLSDGTSNNYLTIYGNPFDNVMRVDIKISGGSTYTPGGFTMANGLNRVAFRASPTEAALCLNGGTPTTVALPSALPTITQLGVGNDQNLGGQWQRPISRAAIFPRGTSALVSNVALQRMSAL